IEERTTMLTRPVTPRRGVQTPLSSEAVGSDPTFGRPSCEATPMTPPGILERAQPRRPRWRRWGARLVALVVLAGAMTAAAVVARDAWDRTGGPRVEASPGRQDISSPLPRGTDAGATVQQPAGDEGDDGVLPPL